MRNQSGLRTLLLACCYGAACWASFASPVHAQRQGPSVTVQLPEFHYFGTSTTVLVPDRGATSLGGVSRSSSGQTTRGVPLLPFANRGSWRTAGAGSVGMGAWIHDHEAMDAALLAEAASRRGAPLVLRPEPPPATAASDTPLLSAEEHARRQAAQQDEQQAEAARHFAKGQSLLAEGKPGVARVYFQMALRRAEGPLKAEIASALAAARR